MTSVVLNVPDLGVDGSVEVVEVLVQTGDTVAVDDPVCVLETDKATMEIPSEHAGVIEQVSVSIGDQVKEGDHLLSLSLESSSATSDPESDPAADSVSTESSSENGPDSEVDSAPDSAVDNNRTNQSANEPLPILVPDLGGAEEVEVIEILVKAGDSLSQDQTLVVLESDKASMEIPAPADGKCEEIVLKVGDTVSEGSVIGTYLPSGGQSAAQEVPTKAEPEGSQPKATVFAQADAPEPMPVQAAGPVKATSASSGRPVHAGPAVRKLAREMGVDLSEVKGTGPGLRVLKDDVKAFVKLALSSSQRGQTSVQRSVKLPDFSQFGEIETVAMDKIQRVTAENMQLSWSTIPHVTQFDQADITELEAFRKSKRNEADARKTKLTMLPFLLKACAYALSRLPQFNVSLDMDNHQVIRKRFIHIGVAVDTPNGLVVPVVRNVDQKGLWELAEEILELAALARDRKLKPAQMQGGCFTISSLGGIGGTAFTPIVNSPEVAILGVSKSSMQPVYVDGAFEPRLLLPLSLSYDHRAVNGADAARFTSLVSALLGDLRELLL